jgi:flagellum-specific peptidoglycan hydrolase FlgJ
MEFQNTNQTIGMVLIIILSVLWINSNISQSKASISNAISTQLETKMDSFNKNQKIEINLNGSLLQNTSPTSSFGGKIPSVGEKHSKYSIIGAAMKPTHKRHKEAKSKVLAYINQYASLAQEEYKAFGILPSITLAQGLLESNVGQSKLALQNNNHFGLKCFSKQCKAGHCTNFGDDTHKDFFRKFDTVWWSYRYHSKLLKKPRYRKCYTCNSDYKCWAKALKKAGYATDKHYHNTLIKIIEYFNLTKYDV